MKKIRLIATVCIICLLLGGCASRKAPAQIKKSPYLHAVGTTVLDGKNEEIMLASGRVTLSATQENEDLQQEILAKEKYNALTLSLSTDLIDTDSGASLSKLGREYVQAALGRCTDEGKYLLLEFAEYPDHHYAWQNEEVFLQNVCSLWSEVAELVAGEVYFGAYVINNIPRPASMQGITDLEQYEAFLQKVCDGIREKDADHMISLEMLTPYFESDEYHGFPMVKDRNFSYLAAMTDTDFYTLQTKKEEDGTAHLVYPNSFWYDIEGDEEYEEIIGSKLSTDSIDYQTRATEVFTATKEGTFARIGAIVVPDEYGGGELKVQSIRLAECDEKGKEKSVIYNMDSSVGINFEYNTAQGITNEGSVHDDGTAYLYQISGTTFFYVSNLNIPLETGKHYQLTVTMKQRGMNRSYVCAPAVRLYSCEQHASFDAEYLKKCCDKLFLEASEVGVPLIFNDVGVSTVAKKRGGEQFLADLVSAITSLKQSYIAN